jgi:hypothetical protein
MIRRDSHVGSTKMARVERHGAELVQIRSDRKTRKDEERLVGSYHWLRGTSNYLVQSGLAEVMQFEFVDKFLSSIDHLLRGTLGTETDCATNNFVNQTERRRVQSK